MSTLAGSGDGEESDFPFEADILNAKSVISAAVSDKYPTGLRLLAEPSPEFLPAALSRLLGERLLLPRGSGAGIEPLQPK